MTTDFTEVNRLLLYCKYGSEYQISIEEPTDLRLFEEFLVIDKNKQLYSITKNTDALTATLRIIFVESKNKSKLNEIPVVPVFLLDKIGEDASIYFIKMDELFMV